MPLTDLAVKNAEPRDKAYKLSDSQGLFLLVNPNGAKYWRLKYRYAGKEKLLALGVYCGPTTYSASGKPEAPKVQMRLADARAARDTARDQIKAGIDPSEAKRQDEQARRNAAANSLESVAQEWHTNSRAKWSPDHADRVWKRIADDVLPTIGRMAIESIKARDLLQVLRNVEKRGALDVAGRIRQHLNGIMRYAVQTDRIERNPAADLQGALVVPEKKHRPALPLERIPELLQRIDAYQGRLLTRLAVRFALLTVVRSQEVRGMLWSEIDHERALWIVPAERMKMKTPHVVPLSRQALAVLDELKALSGRFPLVFPGDHDPEQWMSENTHNRALRGMGYDTKTEVCLHGFRAMACSAMNESGMWQKDAIERQMSHQERNGVRAAYIHKAEYLNQRRQMMQWWADYLDAQAAGRYVAPDEFGTGQGNVVMLPVRNTA